MVVLLGIFACSTAIDAVSAIYSGFVIMMLWNWFIFTTFHIRTIGFLQAMGLGVVVAFLTSKYIPDPEDFFDSVTGRIFYAFAAPTSALVIGGIIHALM